MTARHGDFVFKARCDNPFHQTISDDEEYREYEIEAGELAASTAQPYSECLLMRHFYPGRDAGFDEGGILDADLRCHAERGNFKIRSWTFAEPQFRPDTQHPITPGGCLAPVMKIFQIEARLNCADHRTAKRGGLFIELLMAEIPSAPLMGNVQGRWKRVTGTWS